MIGQWSVVAWVLLVGLMVTLPAALASGVPPALDATTGSWLVVAGVAGVFGLVATYAALSVGKVGVVTPVVAAEGAVAALLSSVFGESVAPLVAGCLLVVAIGVVVSAVAPDPVPVENERPVRAVVLAVSAAGLFGLSLFATGHVSGDLPAAWLVLPPRVLGVLLVTVPLLLSRRLRLTRKAAPLVVASGLAEVLGYVAFAQGARESVAVVAVVASQFAPLAAIAAYLLFRERLGRVQVAGVGLLVLGITALTAATST